MDRKNPPSSIDPKGLKEVGTLAAITHLFPLLCWGPVATGKAACASERPRPGRCGYSHAEGERQSKEVRETLIEAGEQRGGNRSFCLLLGDDDSLRAPSSSSRLVALGSGRRRERGLYVSHSAAKGVKVINSTLDIEGRRKRLKEISFEGRERERAVVASSSSISSFSLIFPETKSRKFRPSQLC